MKKRNDNDYRKLLKSLLPLGKLWNRHDDSILGEFLYGLGGELARVETRSFDLIDESIITTVEELISEYEVEYGLPEPGWELADTLVERRNDIRRKMTTIGQHDITYLLNFGDEVGYDIEIEEYRPFICGISECGDYVLGLDSVFYWTIKSSTDGIFGAFGVGFQDNQFDSTFKENIDYVLSMKRSLDWLIFNFEKIKPAHTIALYDFVDSGFDRSFDFSFDSFPSHDGNVPFEQFSSAFGDGFTNAERYDGTYLTGAFGRDFYLSFDGHFGAEFDNTAFGDGFAKPL